MEFTNHTPFPALAFEGIDQHAQRFHVLVLRQTFTFETGVLKFADEQAPLCEVDEYFGEMNVSSVRVESDLCHYKPKCDVIVNATAYAPGGQPAARFSVAVKVIDRQRREVLNKQLTVTGPRHWTKKKVKWPLSEPEPIVALALRDEVAYGGECRIYPDEPAAARVKPEHHLTPEQRAQHPDSAHPPVVHAVYAQNPLGIGYAEAWMVDALQLDHISAPQIESPGDPVTTFGKAYSPCSLGVRSKAHPERRKLGGTIDTAFIEGDAWLPDDFDFAVWNAARPDQQTDFLHGDETIELTNLCAPDAPGATNDEQGNTVLRLKLPEDKPFALVRFESGYIIERPINIDTLVIDPEQHQITCVWRAIFGTQPEVRVLEARMLQKADVEALRVTANQGETTKGGPIRG